MAREELTLNTIHDLLEAKENVLFARAINHFIGNLAMELYNGEEVPTQDYQNFISEQTTELKRETNIRCTDDIWFIVRFTITADLLRNKIDESNVGLGGMDVIYDYENVNVVVDKIIFNLLDTEWDLSNHAYLPEIIGQALEEI